MSRDKRKRRRRPKPRVRPQLVAGTLASKLEEFNDRGRLSRSARRSVYFQYGRRDKPIFSSRLLERYAQGVGLGRIRRDTDFYEIEAPATLSLIEAPDVALGFLKEFLRIARNGARRVSIDQTPCESMDLCAAAVLNVLAMESHHRLHTRLAGRYPLKRELREIVAAVGLPKLLRTDLPDHDDFHTFRLRQGGTKRRTFALPTQKEIVAGDLAKYFEECLARAGSAEFEEVRNELGEIIGEVLGNAEDHARENDWYVAGYLRTPPDQPYADCHLTLFNFGRTLSETIRTIEGENKQDLLDILRVHRQAGYFNNHPGWTEEAFWTVQALQEGVSSKSSATTSRGVGTPDIISAFEQLRKTSAPGCQPVMCLVSGHTHITFREQFPMKKAEMIDGPPRRVIAFNDENDLFSPPSPQCVRELQEFFPGTLISIRFYLDRRYPANTRGTSDSPSD